MEEVQLSAKAKRQMAALEASNERKRLETLQLEAKIQALEELARRKEKLLCREREFLAEVEAERQAIDAEYQRIHRMSPLLT